MSRLKTTRKAREAIVVAGEIFRENCSDISERRIVRMKQNCEEVAHASGEPPTLVAIAHLWHHLKKSSW